MGTLNAIYIYNIFITTNFQVVITGQLLDLPLALLQPVLPLPAQLRVQVDDPLLLLLAVHEAGDEVPQPQYVHLEEEGRVQDGVAGGHARYHLIRYRPRRWQAACDEEI